MVAFSLLPERNFPISVCSSAPLPGRSAAFAQPADELRHADQARLPYALRIEYRVHLGDDGAGIKGESVEDLFKGDNAVIPNFRPICGAVAPDGSFYFCDWAKPLIGHMQHHIRDPKRDKTHGRIYRVTYEGRPLLKPVKIAGEPVEKLLEVLKTPEDDVRTRAKIELSKHDSAKVIAATKKWIAGLSKTDKDYEHHRLEGLWVHQWHNVVDEALLKDVLKSPDHRARAAATRVLCYWRDRVKEPLKLLQASAQDEHPRVRLEAIRACSFFTTSAAAEVALSAIEKEKDPNKPDYYIKYCLDETMKQLGKSSSPKPLCAARSKLIWWRPAI